MKQKKSGKKMNLKKFTVSNLDKIKASGVIHQSHWDQGATCWTLYVNSQCSGNTVCETEDCCGVLESQA